MSFLKSINIQAPSIIILTSGITKGMLIDFWINLLRKIWLLLYSIGEVKCVYGTILGKIISLSKRNSECFKFWTLAIKCLVQNPNNLMYMKCISLVKMITQSRAYVIAHVFNIFESCLDHLWIKIERRYSPRKTIHI